jgi:hypothetical protein
MVLSRPPSRLPVRPSRRSFIAAPWRSLHALKLERLFRPGPPIYVLTEHATVARQTTGLLRGVSLLQFVVLLKWTRRMIDKLRHLQNRRSYCCGDWDDHSHEGSNQFNARAVCVEFFFENTSLIATTFHTICICAQFFAF